MLIKVMLSICTTGERRCCNTLVFAEALPDDELLRKFSNSANDKTSTVWILIESLGLLKAASYESKIGQFVLDRLYFNYSQYVNKVQS